MCVKSLTTRISAPATLAPLGSVTMPLIIPAGDCAHNPRASRIEKTRSEPQEKPRRRKGPSPEAKYSSLKRSMRMTGGFVSIASSPVCHTTYSRGPADGGNTGHMHSVLSRVSRRRNTRMSLRIAYYHDRYVIVRDEHI